MDLLATTLEHTRGDLTRADATAIGHIVAIAGLAALVGQIGKDLPAHLLLAASAAALPGLATLALALSVLKPRGRRPTGLIPPGSWVHAIHTPTAARLLADYDQADPRDTTARQLRALAFIADAKFTWLARSTMALTGTLTTLAAAYLYGALSALI